MMSGPGPELWGAAVLTCPYCHAMVAPSQMKPHDDWHMLIARLLKEAGAEIEIRS